ncbi:MAG: hypothetical protein IT384_14875 [Deltaproteobacteria bacterium]|nr:hypothetical protein [Deltaproteobacteria bacterium]
MLITAALALVASSTLAGPAPQPIAVYGLVAPPELATLAQQLGEEAVLHLSRIRGVRAISEAEIALLARHRRDLHEVGACGGDEACLAALARVADVEQAVTGRLGRFGPGFLLTLSLASTRDAAILRSHSITADREDELLRSLGRALETLLERESETRSETRSASVALSLPPGTKLAVLDLAAYDARPDLAGNLTQLLALELRRAGELGVISREEIKTMLRYQAEKHLIECQDDLACLAEIGGALGVEYLVSGAIGRLADTYVLHLKLMNVSKAEVVQRVSESFRGPEAGLTDSVRFAAGALLGRSRAGRGTLEIRDVEPGTAVVDATARASVPGVIEALATGKHTLSVRVEGFEPYWQEFYVEADVTTRLRPALEPIPKRWYQEWWPWLLAGVAATTAVTTAVIVAGQAPNAQVNVGIAGAP